MHGSVLAKFQFLDHSFGVLRISRCGCTKLVRITDPRVLLSVGSIARGRAPSLPLAMTILTTASSPDRKWYFFSFLASQVRNTHAEYCNTTQRLAAMASKFFAIVAGVGAGTGRSVALKFAKTYPVVLLARKPESYSSVMAEIRSQGGVAVGISTDTSDAQSVASAFETIKKELPDQKLAAAIYNVGAGRTMKGFLELTPDDLRASLEGNA